MAIDYQMKGSDCIISGHPLRQMAALGPPTRSLMLLGTIVVGRLGRIVDLGRKGGVCRNGVHHE